MATFAQRAMEYLVKEKLYSITTELYGDRGGRVYCRPRSLFHPVPGSP
jgi:hypothetical protein